MIANLPLLFANGHPVALNKITVDELEKFITFMVTCSWGHDTAKDIRQPPWWPKDVEFSHPFVRPTSSPLPPDWEDRLKNLVRCCYDYHKSAFLLVFSGQLSRYQRNRLRYVDNRDHTTSLYYRPSGRLLVTFRNENLNYDQKTPPDQNNLLLKSTDIYLCDNCDSHFDNLDLLKAHERLCNNEVAPSTSCNGGLPEFLSALKLQPVGFKVEVENASYTNSEIKPKTVRSSAHIDRGPPYPFSSLAYTKNIKPIQRDTTYIRERIERYCCTSTISNKAVTMKQFPVRYRRPIDYWNRRHVFPEQRNKELLDIKGQLLYLKCRPLRVKVERMSPASMQEYINTLRKEAEARREREEKDIVVLDGFDDDSNETEMKTIDPLTRDSECEVIDLCSDSESAEGGEGAVCNENVDPRAGVACVMRGGAVLRRTAATPRQLPAEPCGARHRPFVSLHKHPSVHPPPHPVILIAHTLNNLQTISLE